MWSEIILVIAFVAMTYGGENKIIGGREAQDGEFPYAVAVVCEKFRCGGGLITLNKIITAAHCLKGIINGEKYELKPEELQIYAGEVTYRTETPQRQIAKGKSIKFPEGFGIVPGSKIYYHDIASVDLANSLVASDVVMPLKVVSTDPAKFREAYDAHIAAGKTCLAMGWGVISVTTDAEGNELAGKFTGTLKVLEVKPWDEATCLKHKNYQSNTNLVRQGEMCVSGVNQGESVCIGDAGTPFECGGYVYGISLHATKCVGTTDPFAILLFQHYITFFGFEIGTSASPSTISPLRAGITEYTIIQICFLKLYHMIT